MNKNKKLVISLAAVLLVIAVVIVSALIFGKKKPTDDGWSFENHTLTITCDSMESWESEIPWEDKKPEIKAVVIEDNVQDICKNAFSDCVELEDVSIGNSVKKIGENAFAHCSKLREITIPASVEEVERHAFSDCRELVIKLEADEIPAGFEESWCDDISQVEFDGQTDNYESETTEETASSLSESYIKSIADGNGYVSVFEYADYDGNGTYEAFAVITDGTDNNSIIKTIFISSDGEVITVEDNIDWSAYENDREHTLFVNDKGFFWCDMGAFGSGWKTLLYSVNDDEPYILDISANIQGFYETDGIFYTTQSEFTPSGHEYPNYELIYDEDSQQFSVGEKINID